jgi:hypothetical protein
METTYATLPAMQRQIKIASEDFKYTPSKKQEGVLTGSIGAAPFQTMGIRTENNLSLLARPDDVGLFLKAVLGDEDVVEEVANEEYRHVFTPEMAGLNDKLPSLSFMVDKKTTVFTYSGCKVNTLSFSTAAEDYLNLELEMFGYDEGTGGTMNTTLTPSPLKAFTFSGGKVYFNDVEMADVTSISFSYNNNLENTIQTTSTGLHYLEPNPNLRDITFELEMIYAAAAEQLRQDYFKTDDMLSVKLEFTSIEKMSTNNPYTLTIEVPAAQITECSNAVSDANGIRQTASLTTVDNNVDELITVTLVNAYPSAY